MSILIVGATEREKIAEIIAHAKANPVTFDTVRQGIVSDTPLLRLKDRVPGDNRQGCSGRSLTARPRCESWQGAGRCQKA